MESYHDTEWGVPEHDDRRLFEFLTLEGAQAGLSWEIVLRKRDGYRAAFARFEAARVARFGGRDLRRLLKDSSIVRNRLKIEATIENARRFLEVQDEHGSFARYLWGFVGGHPLRHRFRSPSEVPSKTQESEALSRDLRRRGFRFVGPTIVYAYMQAVGLVNDHLVGCFRYRKGSRSA
jgi:DNA-3-methyladenine glycosylase I